MPNAEPSGTTSPAPGVAEGATPVLASLVAEREQKVHRVAKKSELVARSLARFLLTDPDSAGTVLDVEPDLIKRLGVSRGTLREGLRLLEVLGVVESRLGRSGGIVVHRPTAQHFAQIVTFYLQFSGCTFRQFLAVHEEVTPLIMRMVADGVTDDVRAELDVIMEEFETLPIAQQVRTVPVINGFYYDQLDNPMWALLARSLQAVISGNLETLVVHEDEWPKIVNTVRRLASSVRDGDGARAERVARAQIAAWLHIAETYQSDLLASQIVWATDDEVASRGS